MIFKKEKKENNTIKSLIVVFAIIVTFTCGYLLGLYSTDNINKKRTNKKETIEKKSVVKKVHTKDYKDEEGNSYIEVYYENQKLDLEYEDNNIIKIDKVNTSGNLTIFNAYFSDGVELVIVNNYGNIVGTYIGNIFQNDVNMIKLSGKIYNGIYEIKDNKIYVTSSDWNIDNICIKEKEEYAEYIDEIYLTNSKLNNISLYSKITVDDVITRDNINCDNK